MKELNVAISASLTVFIIVFIGGYISYGSFGNAFMFAVGSLIFGSLGGLLGLAIIRLFEKVFG